MSVRPYIEDVEWVTIGGMRAGNESEIDAMGRFSSGEEVKTALAAYVRDGGDSPRRTRRLTRVIVRRSWDQRESILVGAREAGTSRVQALRRFRTKTRLISNRAGRGASTTASVLQPASATRMGDYRRVPSWQASDLFSSRRLAGTRPRPDRRVRSNHVFRQYSFWSRPPAQPTVPRPCAHA